MDTVGKLLEEMILERLQGHMVGENGLSENQFGIDIRNAFNIVRWNICVEAMMRKKVPDYLLQMIDDNLSDRWMIYESDK